MSEQDSLFEPSGEFETTANNPRQVRDDITTGIESQTHGVDAVLKRIGASLEEVGISVPVAEVLRHYMLADSAPKDAASVELRKLIDPE